MRKDQEGRSRSNTSMYHMQLPLVAIVLPDSDYASMTLLVSEIRIPPPRSVD
ncbi:hypothetical protein J6590_019808 [Homalodisca vitripennis]|nr:hypothetical protein J6590_019808 [Homalodisca vitripennis]